MGTAFPLLIGGNWVRGDGRVANLNPSDLDTPIGDFDTASLRQADAAISAASEAFGPWGATEPVLRAEILQSIGDRIVAERERLGAVLSSEEGKTLREGVGEATRAGRTFQYFAHRLRSSHGTVLPSMRRGVMIHTRVKPVGVVGIISPWNFPLAVPAWKIAPALAAGNTVVFKPAESVPASAWELARIIHEAGVAPGAFNLVTGAGNVVGERLATHAEVRAVSFTGSTGVGARLIRAAHEHSNKRVQAEMGGKNPIVIASDADIEVAVAAVIDSCFGSTGQRCTATSRIIVLSEIHDRFVDALLPALKSLRVGHAFDSVTDVGPVANAAQLAVDRAAIATGIQEGATLLVGGEEVERSTRGHFLSPALFVDGESEMRINQEETFGPVACVIRVGDIESAIAAANAVPYGLSAGIITRSLSTSEEFQSRVEAGLVTVNESPAVSELHAPFGGTKASSYGPREQGETGLDFYTTQSTHFVGA